MQDYTPPPPKRIIEKIILCLLLDVFENKQTKINSLLLKAVMFPGSWLFRCSCCRCSTSSVTMIISKWQQSLPMYGKYTQAQMMVTAVNDVWWEGDHVVFVWFRWVTDTGDYQVLSVPFFKECASSHGCTYICPGIKRAQCYPINKGRY